MISEVLDFAYCNDFVDTLNCAESTLRKYEQKGLIKFWKQKGKRLIFILTETGLAEYFKQKRT